MLKPKALELMFVTVNEPIDQKDNVGASREDSLESDNDSKRKNIKAQATRQQC